MENESSHAGKREAMVLMPCEPHELVRGQEQCLLERVAPAIASQDVTLDMRCVTRIDAAGIAALIALYRAAEKAGTRFVILHATPHVAAILALVGLDRILFSQEKEVESSRLNPVAA